MSARRLRPLLALLSAMLACTAHAIEWRPALAGLEAPEIQATHALLADVEARLPAQWRASLGGGPIRFEWRRDLPRGVHGRAFDGRVLLDRRLLDGWVGGDKAADFEATRTPARAALIHELAHLFDRSPQGRLSSDARLLDLAGWQRRPLTPGLRRRDSAFSDRSPDAYERHDPMEFVAVNLEHALLDPEYACRRPALHAYFTERVGLPAPAHACPATRVFVQPEATGDSATPLLSLDPSRIYEIDYLLAEPDTRVMSRWGHSMLRLVVCAPGRAPGPDCRLDLAHHQVLSFRAFVDDVQISNWRGLTGAYPSRLFVLPLAQVIEEYTRVELRGLRSVPLRLERAEIDALLERAAQLHWTYDGRYAFVSNNCAVETWKLLHDANPRLAAAPLASITPTGLLRRLERHGVADAGVLADRDRARRLGYHFEPLSAHYQAMLDIASTSLPLPHVTAQDWLDASPAHRAPWIEHADLRAAAALLLLERAALRREELRARDELKRRLLGAPPEAEDSTAIVPALRALIGLESRLARPALSAPDGYGLPQPAEVDAMQNDLAADAERWRGQWDGLLRRGRAALPDAQRAALELTESNIARLGLRIGELRRAE